jgi:hypothetical protein
LILPGFCAFKQGKKIMALDTLRDVKVIGGFEVVREKPFDMDWNIFDQLRKEKPIFITDSQNMISFRIQDGPIKEVGVNGCQVDTMIEVAKLIIEGLNKKFPCIENAMMIHRLGEALDWSEERKRNREKRQVEGTSQI